MKTESNNNTNEELRFIISIITHHYTILLAVTEDSFSKSEHE